MFRPFCQFAAQAVTVICYLFAGAVMIHKGRSNLVTAASQRTWHCVWETREGEGQGTIALDRALLSSYRLSPFRYMWWCGGKFAMQMSTGAHAPKSPFPADHNPWLEHCYLEPHKRPYRYMWWCGGKFAMQKIPNGFLFPQTALTRTWVWQTSKHADGQTTLRQNLPH